MTLKRIQKEQSKAFEKIEKASQEYPKKIQILLDELKFCKDKIKDQEEKGWKEQKTAIAYQEKMIKMEEQCRELKEKLKSKANTQIVEPINFQVDE